MKKKYLIIILVAVAAAAAALFLLLPTKKGAITLSTAKAERSFLSTSVTATGTIEPVTEVEVGIPERHFGSVPIRFSKAAA